MNIWKLWSVPNFAHDDTGSGFDDTNKHISIAVSNTFELVPKGVDIKSETANIAEDWNDFEISFRAIISEIGDIKSQVHRNECIELLQSLYLNRNAYINAQIKWMPHMILLLFEQLNELYKEMERLWIISTDNKIKLLHADLQWIYDNTKKNIVNRMF